MRYQAFIFDFDGVLADSVEVKTRAFELLYLPHGANIAQRVVQYHRENGGIPRRQKFRYFESVFLEAVPDSAKLDNLCSQFSKLVVDEVVKAKEIAGAKAFLQHWHGRLPMYINSASPDRELNTILEQRELHHFFDAVYGSTNSKTENHTKIISSGKYTPERVLFFGDTESDLKTARVCGTSFVGILSSPNSPLAQESDIVCVKNFNDMTNFFSKDFQ